MNMLCLRCGELWDQDTALHDEPKRFLRKGSVIYTCPNCVGKLQHELKPPPKLKLALCSRRYPIR